MQVHDELVLEVPDDEIEMVKYELPRAYGRRRQTRRAIAGGGRRGPELGTGALTLPSSSPKLRLLAVHIACSRRSLVFRLKCVVKRIYTC